MDLGNIKKTQLNEAFAFQVGIGKAELDDISISSDVISVVGAESSAATIAKLEDKEEKLENVLELLDDTIE